MQQHTYPPHTIYIGLQKTGSTYLRNYFFNHPEVYCSRKGAFFQTDSADINLHGELAVRISYESLFEQNPGKPCRIDMYEAIGMGYVLNGLDAWTAHDFIRVDTKLNSGHIVTDHAQVAARVKAALPDARILMTVRNQPLWLSSNYRHFFEQLPKGRETLLDFLSTPEGKIVLDAAMFDRIVDIYDRVFGIERVHVLPMECLKHDEEQALRNLCKFLDIHFTPYKNDDKKYNEGRNLDALMAARYQDLAKPPGLISQIFGHAKSQQRLTTEETIKQLSLVYAASNTRLANRLGLDLESLGYPF